MPELGKNELMAFLVLAGITAGCPAPPPTPAQSAGRGAAAPPPSPADAGVASFAQPPPPIDAAPVATAPVVYELCDESLCGPRPAYPNRLCADGVHSEGPGPCVKQPGGGCGWFRLTCPAPGGAVPQFITDDPRILLKSRQPADRVRGAEMIRTNQVGLGVRQRSDQFVPLLSGCLTFPDEGVRLAAVAALATLDDRVMPILQRARLRETSYRVNQAIDAILRRNQPPAPVITAAECSKKNRKKMMSWPIHELCDPIGHYPPILFPLGDGTNIYQGRAKGQACFRGRRKQRCYLKCLPGDSRIATPKGPVRARELRVGDPVWTFDVTGRRIARPIAKVGSVFAGDHHRLLEVTLSDGRRVRASSPHPTATGQLSDLTVGSTFDGAIVTAIDQVPMAGRHTFDLLPAGPSGLYIADGVILGSTLGPSGNRGGLRRAPHRHRRR